MNTKLERQTQTHTMKATSVSETDSPLTISRIMFLITVSACARDIFSVQAYELIPIKHIITHWWCLNYRCIRNINISTVMFLCVPAASTDGRRQSRSAVSEALLVPWTRTSTGQRSFAVHGQRTWNRLPAALRSPGLSLHAFKHQLKAHLFQH